eukprot:624344-Karenia_brevis.AAC.1
MILPLLGERGALSTGPGWRDFKAGRRPKDRPALRAVSSRLGLPQPQHAEMCICTSHLAAHLMYAQCIAN